MSDEFDTTEAQIDAMFAAGEPAEVTGPSGLPFGATFTPGTLTASLGATVTGTLPRSATRTAVTAAA